MRVVELHPLGKLDYSCNVYWVLGEHNRSHDVNTLVDTGSTSPENIEHICKQMEHYSKGIGKAAVEQVILTHGHFDHNGGLPAVIQRFHPLVQAFAPDEGVDRQLSDGQLIPMGDRMFEVLHLPGHSEDSVCLYCAAEGVRFSGDALSVANCPSAKSLPPPRETRAPASSRA